MVMMQHNEAIRTKLLKMVIVPGLLKHRNCQYLFSFVLILITV